MKVWNAVSGELASKNICILSETKTAIKAHDNFQINSKLAWDCHQSMVKLVEHNMILLIWVPGHMGIY